MRRYRTALLWISALGALAPAGAPAQESSMRGTWALNREHSDDINAKINTTISRMNIVVRQIARPRLRSTNLPYPELVFTIDENIRVDMRNRPSVISPVNGEPVLWNRHTGESCPQVHGDCVEVTTTWQDGALVQTFRAKDGQRQNVFTVSGDRLTMVVTVTSPRLPTPLNYRLVYDRAS
jgi:hypothetical protein